MEISSARLSRSGSWLVAGWLASLGLSACIEDQPGISPPSTAGSAGTKATAGSASTAGSAAMNEGGSRDIPEPTAGQATGGDAASGGTPSAGGVSVMAGSAGMPMDDVGGASAAGAGGADDEGVHIADACVFHSAPVPPEVGAGGAGPSGPSITLQVSPFLGSYLADAQGRTLYTYGADLPGDCNTPPVSGCVADCLTSWPIFDAGERVLPPELSDAGFGTIARTEGGYQTTYMGWPLYYYKSDLTLGQMTGQGKGKIWHAAETTLPTITIMKAGAVKYLADGAGRTLYVSAADVPGTVDADPVSNCSGACSKTFEGFHDPKLSLVSSLEPLDFGVFVRHGAGGLQLAYKGMPLYRAATDQKSGDMTGTLISGFTAAVP